MKLQKRFRADQEAVVKGVWRSIGDGGELLIARMNNKPSLIYYQELTQIHSEALKSPDAAIREAAESDLMIRVLARFVLLDWRGMETDTGEEWKYSEESAILMLKETDFRDLVSMLANDREAYLVSTQEKLEGNSLPAPFGI